MDPNPYQEQQEKASHLAAQQNLPPQPDAAASSSSRKKLLWIIGIMLLLGIGMSGSYFLGKNTSQPAIHQIAAEISPTTIPTPTVSETANFPIYPGATFTKKEIHEPCTSELKPGGTIICSTTEFAYTAPDSWSKVSEWYSNRIGSTGWTCNGGGGTIGNSTENCSNGVYTFALLLDGVTKANKTIIRFYIPPNTISSTNSPALTTNTSIKTYTDSIYSITYPSSWESKADTTSYHNHFFSNPAKIQTIPNNGSGTTSFSTEFVTVSWFASSTTLQEYAKQRTGEPEYTGVDAPKTITFNGLPAITYPESGEGASGYDIIVSTGSKLVTLTIPEAYPPTSPTIKQMLASFKLAQ